MCYLIRCIYSSVAAGDRRHRYCIQIKIVKRTTASEYNYVKTKYIN